LIFREAAGFNVGELSKSVDHFIPALDKHFVGIVSQLGASFRRERTLKSAPVFFLQRFIDHQLSGCGGASCEIPTGKSPRQNVNQL
jgi:hypothetical protein